MERTEDIEELVLKYLKEEATAEECSVVESWISASPDNLRQFNAVKSIVDASEITIDYDSIDTERAYRNVLVRSNRHRMPFLYYFQRIAAVLIIPLATISAILAAKLLTGSDDTASPLQKLSVPFGAVAEFDLSDGSKVWLGSGSHLECPVSFGNGLRTVSLEGEALFSVASDVDHPFVVNAGEMSVTAVGTEFMVNSYDRDSLAVVALRKGAVNVNFRSRPGLCVKMKPDDVLTFHKNSSDYDVATSNLDKWYCWTNGRIVFSKDRFDSVLSRLEQLYDVDFKLDDPSIRSYLYRASFSDESFEEILSIIQMSIPVKFRRIDTDGGSRVTYEVVALK